MAGLLFGTGGSPHSARVLSTQSGNERIAELELGCMEVEFVQGVKMGREAAVQVGETATKLGIKLSAHAPYFMNFNAHEQEKIKASQDRLLQTARIASLCGAESVVFHTAFYLGDLPDKAYSSAKKYLAETSTRIRNSAPRVIQAVNSPLTLSVSIFSIKRPTRFILPPQE